MSKSNTCLTYAVSFTEAEAKGIPRTQKLLCNMNARTKRTMNYECKRNKKVRRPLSRMPRRRSKDQWKTSKLIAYLSTRTCKICQCDVQCFVKQLDRHAGKPSFCRLKLIKIVPN